MTWKMRTTLAREFGITFVDSDPGMNEVLNRYEDILFKNPRPDSLASLWKTDVKAGELLNSVTENGRGVFYPKPFVFSLLPDESRFQERDQSQRLSRALCLYDNAGEHFMPGGDNLGRFVTKHLGFRVRCCICSIPRSTTNSAWPARAKAMIRNSAIMGL